MGGDHAIHTVRPTLGAVRDRQRALARRAGDADRLEAFIPAA
jgi:hypothetical protein